MSNLLTNGNFSSPSISSNTYIYYPTLTSTQKTNIYWTTTNSTYSALINGSSGFAYPSISGQSFKHYASFQSGAELEQIANISLRSNLTLTFSYGYRTVSTFPPNTIKINFGGTLHLIIAPRKDGFPTVSRFILTAVYNYFNLLVIFLPLILILLLEIFH